MKHHDFLCIKQASPPREKNRKNTRSGHLRDHGKKESEQLSLKKIALSYSLEFKNLN